MVTGRRGGSSFTDQGKIYIVGKWGETKSQNKREEEKDGSGLRTWEHGRREGQRKRVTDNTHIDSVVHPNDRDRSEVRQVTSQHATE